MPEDWNDHHDRQADNLGAGLKVAKRRMFGHQTRVLIRTARLKLVSSDKTQTSHKRTLPKGRHPDMTKPAREPSPDGHGGNDNDAS
jgi:hypothetical protein